MKGKENTVRKEKKTSEHKQEQVHEHTHDHGHEGHDHSHEHKEEKKIESTPAVAKGKALEVKKEVIELEREYVIPLRKEIRKVADYRRAKKAIYGIRKFLAKHMRVEDRDFRKIKIDKYLNNEVWFRGIANPLHKVKVKAKKIDGVVYAELADVPEKVKFDKLRDEKRKSQEEKMKVKTPKHDKEHDHIEESEKKKTQDQKTDVIEKEKATVEAGHKMEKTEAKKKKHTSSGVRKEDVTPAKTSLKKGL